MQDIQLVDRERLDGEVSEEEEEFEADEEEMSGEGADALVSP